MNRIKDYAKRYDHCGYRSLSLEPGLPILFRIDFLERELPSTYKGLGGTLRSFSGRGTFCISGVGGTDEVVSSLAYKQENVVVDVDVRGMRISCSIVSGDGERFYFDPSYVDFRLASYLGESFSRMVRKQFAVELAAKRSHYSGDTFSYRFLIEKIMVPGSIDEFQLRSAVEEVGAQLLPCSLLRLEFCERFYRVRRLFDDYTEQPLLEYMIHRELRIIDPTLGVESWLPPTGNSEQYSFVDLLDGQSSSQGA